MSCLVAFCGWMLVNAMPCAGPARHVSTHTSPVDGVLAAVEAAQADEAVLQQDGNTLMRWSSRRFEPPYELMSVTKSVVALALGKLVDEGRLSLNDSLDKFFPSLGKTPRGKITVEQLLRHTSGLSNVPPEQTSAGPPDIIVQALSQPLINVPGEVSKYNNVAVNLLSGVVEQITGKSLEAYVEATLLLPLGCTRYTWYGDEAGHTWVMTGLALGPTDLAKIGQLMANRGIWQGRRIVSAGWVERLSTPSPLARNSGLLWYVTLPGFGGQFPYAATDWLARFVSTSDGVR